MWHFLGVCPKIANNINGLDNSTWHFLGADFLILILWV